MSRENYTITKDNLRFQFIGLSDRFRKKVSTFQVGDKMVYYLTRMHAFAAVVNVSGRSFKDTNDLWISDFHVFPIRIPTKAELVLNTNFLKIDKLISKLDFISHKDQWGVYFRQSIREIPRSDFQIIKSAMQRLL